MWRLLLLVLALFFSAKAPSASAISYGQSTFYDRSPHHHGNLPQRFELLLCLRRLTERASQAL